MKRAAGILAQVATAFLATAAPDLSADTSGNRPPLARWNFSDRDRVAWLSDGPHPVAFPANARSGGTCLHLKVQPGHSCAQDVAGHPEQWTRVYRKVALPARTKYLRCWMKVTGAAWHEPGRALVDNGVERKLLNVTGDGGGRGTSYDWACYDVDISEFRGQTILLGFVAANWNGFGDHDTDILVDDVSITDADKHVVRAAVWPAASPNGRALSRQEIDENKRRTPGK